MPPPGSIDPTGRLSAGPVHDKASEAAVRPATASHDIARPGLAVRDGIRPDIRSEEDKPAPPIPETMGNLILRSIQSAEPPPTVEGTPAPKTDIAETLQNVAKQVLVTKSGADQAEVRIRLNANVLEGAEIVVNRDANGLNI
ncbi:MAG: hypothetical protein GY947_24490, partial [Rhodobacteraceae bacterium]|nr:hypothetical protein [Paracoccaceae bacterium]